MERRNWGSRHRSQGVAEDSLSACPGGEAAAGLDMDRTGTQDTCPCPDEDAGEEEEAAGKDTDSPWTAAGTSRRHSDRLVAARGIVAGSGGAPVFG